jgi:FKBP-type peptidyl-prolyl cis-trans isomerase
MRHACAIGVGLLSLSVLVLVSGCASNAATTTESATATVPGREILSTQREKESYAIGVETARSFKRQGIVLNMDLVSRGMKDIMTDRLPLLNDEEILETLNNFATQRRAARGRDRLIAALENKKQGEDFLEENRTKEGVIALPAGLQYRVIKAGEGRIPGENDTVECQYKGTLLDGTVFENTYEAGRPAVFKVSDIGVILGIRQALKMMPVGSKWQLFVPYQLAYGQRGVPGLIGPNELLLLELELVAIKDQKP